MDLLETLTQTFIEDITNIKNICAYLLVGVIVTFLLEISIRKNNMDLTHAERFWMITGWPLMSVIFIYHFFKGLFGDD